ncbi:MAG TPA: Crp/Fnr family transcriptional regulator [Pyrinomonadaceae bacterium]|nr:Crp/Fnr family transcriptional regulator [Pyrinomonadaceae bacterium]
MSAASLSQSENQILAALPADEYARLGRHLEPVSLRLSEVLFRPDKQIRYVHFPTSCIVSLLTDLEDGAGMEVGLVGREGIAGVSVILGGSETKVATVQAAGDALRVEARAVREEFKRGGELQTLLLRYTHALMAQISQSAVCNVRHGIDGRLARWLLMYHDRLGRDEFELTHEFMANMLGVRRAGVSTAAASLQKKSFIEYKRGRVKLIDREALEDFACECYPIVAEKYDDFLGTREVAR